MGTTYTLIVENSWRRGSWTVAAVFELQKSRIVEAFAPAQMLPPGTVTDELTEHILELANGFPMLMEARAFVERLRDGGAWDEEQAVTAMYAWLEFMLVHRQGIDDAYRVLLVPG